MNRIFLGGVFQDDRIPQFINDSKGSIQFAADGFQKSFIKGLKSHYNNIFVVSAPLIGTFPRNYKKSTLFSSNWIVNHKTIGKTVGFVNLPFFAMITKLLKLCYYLTFSKNTKLVSDIIIYSVHLPYVLSAVFYKLINPNTKLCLIIPDLPQYMSANTSWLYLFLKKIELLIFKMALKYINSFVLITDHMAEELNIESKSWVRIEGMFDSSKLTLLETNNTESKTILYTGTLDSRYGIGILLEAFSQIEDKDYVLWICGDGDMKSVVQLYASNDLRINYYGQVDFQTALQLQQKATVLVNPRTSDGEYTKYSFPIKTMEYLMSGKPTIMNKLPGIPSEYFPFLLFPQNEGIPALTEIIKKVCDCPDDRFVRKSLLGRKFILEEKNPESQIAKLVEILN